MASFKTVRSDLPVMKSKVERFLNTPVALGSSKSASSSFAFGTKSINMSIVIAGAAALVVFCGLWYLSPWFVQKKVKDEKTGKETVQRNYTYILMISIIVAGIIYFGYEKFFTKP